MALVRARSFRWPLRCVFGWLPLVVVVASLARAGVRLCFRPLRLGSCWPCCVAVLLYCLCGGGPVVACVAFCGVVLGFGLGFAAVAVCGRVSAVPFVLAGVGGLVRRLAGLAPAT